MPVVLYSGWLSRDLCRKYPSTTFVFGDNLLGYGRGGQAIIRDMPNAFGVPTKRKPANSPGSFFEDTSESDLDAVLAALKALWEKLAAGETIVIPVNEDGEVSLGLERAELPRRAPSIYQTICTHVWEMCVAHCCETVDGL